MMLAMIISLAMQDLADARDAGTIRAHQPTSALAQCMSDRLDNFLSVRRYNIAGGTALEMGSKLAFMGEKRLMRIEVAEYAGGSNVRTLYRHPLSAKNARKITEKTLRKCS
jgi:hypothetical protein